MAATGGESVARLKAEINANCFQYPPLRASQKPAGGKLGTFSSSVHDETRRSSSSVNWALAAQVSRSDSRGACDGFRDFSMAKEA